MVKARTGKTLSIDVRDALRTEILDGSIPPGTRILLSATASRFGVSQSVIRDALMQMSRQGFIIAEPQLGFRVREVSATNLIDLTEARVLVECHAIAKAVDIGNVQWQSSVLAAHHTLASVPMSDAQTVRGTTREWADAHARFHGVLISGCENATLEEVAATLRESAELYIQWADLKESESARDIPGEHREILDAVLAHDSGEAARLLGEHLQRTCDDRLAAWQASTEADVEVQPRETRSHTLSPQPRRSSR